MPMLASGELTFKIVFLGPRGAAGHVFARRPETWQSERWVHEEGLGEPGEPPMDHTSFDLAREHAGRRHRLYFFGHGISADDFVTLGAATRRAMFTRMDRLVVVLDGTAPQLAASLAADASVPTDGATAIGVRGWSGPPLVIGGRTVEVTPVTDDGVAAWLEAFVQATVASASPPA